ncbi:hypothetical protein Q7P35_007249 [Cladosporium inversicolor]
MGVGSSSHEVHWRGLSRSRTPTYDETPASGTAIHEARAKTQNHSADSNHQSVTTSDPQTTARDVAATSSNNRSIDTPPQGQERTRDNITDDLAILSLLIPSGRVSAKDFMAYHRLQYTRISVLPRSNNVKFKLTTIHVPPASMQRVFNTAELLEMILLVLTPEHLFFKALFTCRGFKAAMEASPACQRSMKAVARGAHFTRSFAGRLIFRLTFTDLSFQRHLFREGFRRLAVSDTLPQRIEVIWFEGDSVDDGHGCACYRNGWYGCICERKADPSRMIWMSSMSATGRHERITFGRIFDAVARRVPVGKRVGGIVVILAEDRHTHCGPLVADAEEQYLGTMSAY